MLRDDSGNGAGRPNKPRNVLGERLEIARGSPWQSDESDGYPSHVGFLKDQLARVLPVPTSLTLSGAFSCLVGLRAAAATIGGCIEPGGKLLRWSVSHDARCSTTYGA
jgi:hypothetical protein